MRTLIALLALGLLVTPVLAAMSLSDLRDELTARTVALAGATDGSEKRELRRLTKARDAVDAYLAATEMTRKTHKLMVKASKLIVRSTTTLPAITEEGQEAIRVTLESAAQKLRAQARGLQLDLSSAEDFDRVGRLLDKGRDRIDAAMTHWPNDPPRTMKGILKAIRCYGRAEKLAERLDKNPGGG